MGKNEHFDPPPPYTATDFSQMNEAPTAPGGPPPPPGFVFNQPNVPTAPPQTG